MTAEVPVVSYPDGHAPDPTRIAGVDLGVIHPFAVSGPDGRGLLISGRAIRAEHRMHLADTKARHKAVAARAPKPGQRGSRRWRAFRARQRKVEARHGRRVRQAIHEAAKTVIAHAVEQRIGTLVVGDPRGVLELKASRRHNLRLRQRRIGQTIAMIADKTALAGINMVLVDERGTSSTCPACSQRIPKPRGRTTVCPHCCFSGHRDMCAAAIIATRSGGPNPAGTACVSTEIMHRRAGRHLPGAGRSRRDPRRHGHSCGGNRVGWPAEARPTADTVAGSRSLQGEDLQQTPGLAGER